MYSFLSSSQLCAEESELFLCPEQMFLGIIIDWFLKYIINAILFLWEVFE